MDLTRRSYLCLVLPSSTPAYPLVFGGNPTPASIPFRLWFLHRIDFRRTGFNVPQRQGLSLYFDHECSHYADSP